MSYIFDVNDETVWSPSLQVGKLYVVFCGSLSTHLNIPSGLVAEASDMYDVDPLLFPDFVYRIADSGTASHPVYHSLVRGFVATSLVMMERGNIGVDVQSAIGHQFSSDIALMRGAMPS